MGRRAILHIGTEKTGTTTLQYTLSGQPELLARHGYRYPSLGAGNAHVAMVTYAADDAIMADLPMLGGQGPTETRTAFDARIAAELAAETAAHPAAVFILSSEHASSRLVSAGMIARLKALLDRHFDRIDVIIYLRRWDRMAISAHSTFVRNGLTTPFTFDRFLDTSYLDYAALLARWEHAFGRDRLQVAIYNREELRNGSIVADFCARFGLPPLADVPDENISLHPDAVGTVVLLNRLLAARPPTIATAIREAVVAALPRKRDAAPVLRRSAQAFVGRYAAQAETIRARYFADRARLFDDRYDDYPEDKPAQARNWEDVAAALIDTLPPLTDANSTLTAQNGLLRARLHLDGGRLREARDAIDCALALHPNIADFHHVLGLIEWKSGNTDAARKVAAHAAALEPDEQAHRNLIAAIG